VLDYTVLYRIILYCTVLYCTVLYWIILYCTALYCTLLYCASPFMSLHVPIDTSHLPTTSLHPYPNNPHFPTHSTPLPPHPLLLITPSTLSHHPLPTPFPSPLPTRTHPLHTSWTVSVSAVCCGAKVRTFTSETLG
jgi:hypothetical protein